MLKTEMRNDRTTHIDTMPMEEALRLINDENRNAVEAVEAAIPQIAIVTEKMAASIQGGGRIFYVGAGTSGRLGVIDAAECPPTYGVSRELFTGIIAGGAACMFTAAENQEDDPVQGEADLRKAGLKAGDVVVGISASGGAAYVTRALEFAREQGAFTAAIVNNHGSKMEQAADITICCDTGAEVVTGSTRMKAGTSQKLVLNMLSTMSLVKCGCVYENMMVNLRPTNIKLRARVIRIVTEILHCSEEEAVSRLDGANWVIRDAVK